MDEFPRRTFVTLFATAAGTAWGWNQMSDATGNRVRGQNSGDGDDTNSDGVTVVTTRKELETAFDDLSAGDTIRITDENAPYRTTQWLDVDVDGVTVVGPGVRRLVEPAEGAGVGGIRIGHNQRCREVDVRGVGYRGTPGGRGNTSERLHGIAVRNATNVTIERNFVRRTYPLQHGDGGSGISAGPDCSNVRISNNQVHEFGDRGVQLGGRQLVVFGNVVTNGLDRPVSCDLWYPDGHNSTAKSVSIFGNLLGNSIEGSLVGIARNASASSNGAASSKAGYVNVFGNVGFGSHKSFCHVRGPNALQNISVQNNVSRQTTEDLDTEQTKKFAGVTVDVEEGRNLSIKNNELYGYSGHGIHVDSDVSNVTVQHNGLFSAGLSGIRLVGASGGLVDGNLVTEAKKTGINLRQTADVVVRGNYVQGVGNAAIVESEDSEGNVYEGNWADGEDPWRFGSATARTLNNTPPTDVHRGASADADGVVRTSFDRPYARRPRLGFGQGIGTVEGVSYVTNGNGNYVGAKIAVGSDDATIDVFVSDG